MNNVPKKHNAPKYPYRELQVGESFLAEGKSHRNISPVNARYSKLLGCKFVSRLEYDEDGKCIGVRVYRES